MNITYKASSNAMDNETINSLSNPLILNKKTSISKISFGCEPVKYKTMVDSFSELIGKSARENIEKVIESVSSSKHALVEKRGDELIFRKRSLGEKTYQTVIDPILFAPIDLINGGLSTLKNIPALKNSKFISNLQNIEILANRNKYRELYSNAMALRHTAEAIQSPEKFFKESHNRLNPGISEYAVKSERTLTRIVSGAIPAFFLANDAYNLSMYVNNNKDLAKKEKQRRFTQELGRVAITALGTFMTLGAFAKKSNNNPNFATAVIAVTTLASEVLGRLVVGTPFYPITKKQAKTYAHLQGKDKINKDKKDKNVNQNKENNQNIKKDPNIMKIIGGMVLIAFGVDAIPKVIKPLNDVVSKISLKYKNYLLKDFSISKNEFKQLMQKLKNNGFEQLANEYEIEAAKIIESGNLTVKEKGLIDSKINEIARAKVDKKFFISPKKYEKEISKIKKTINRKEVMKQLNIVPRNDEIINICDTQNNVKFNLVDQILAFPPKVLWDIITMPYKYVVKPMFEMPKEGIEKIVYYTKNHKWPEPKPLEDKRGKIQMLRDSIKFLRKIDSDPNYKEKMNVAIVDSFDNITKSTISSAEMAGVAKTVMSTITSAFLIFDNYNMVMIDSEGKDKKLASQKAKERTIQRIVRIAYGASIIKFFNGVFKTPYNASLLGSALVTTGNTILTESLERKSVGLPLHEATREEIIETDNKNLSATGIKGLYFRFMSKLTGKKPISETKPDGK